MIIDVTAAALQCTSTGRASAVTEYGSAGLQLNGHNEDRAWLATSPLGCVHCLDSAPSLGTGNCRLIECTHAWSNRNVINHEWAISACIDDDWHFRFAASLPHTRQRMVHQPATIDAEVNLHCGGHQWHKHRVQWEHLSLALPENVITFE